MSARTRTALSAVAALLAVGALAPTAAALSRQEIESWRSFCRDLGYDSVQLTVDDETGQVEAYECFNSDGTP